MGKSELTRNRDSSLVLLGALALCALSALTTSVAQTKAHAEKPEIHRWLPLTKFYDTPQPLPPGKPGNLIRSEEFDEYALPPGVNALRILYHSRSANGDDVASSGFVLYPDQKPPVGGWPIIAWAHEARSVARRCAPSLARILPHGPFLAMYVNLGYVVVATDYAGLGTTFRYAFSDMNSNAADVIYSVPAARAALPAAAARWVAMGSENSSRTVVAVAEQEHDVRDPDYLGSIAVGGLNDPESEYREGEGSSPLFLAYGIKTLYPGFELSEILPEKGLTEYREIEQACEAPATSAGGLVKSAWLENKFVKNFFNRNQLGQRPLSAPLLVLSASSQSSATAAEATSTVSRLCRQGSRVLLERYDDPDPGNVIGDSVRDQMAWIQGRLAGRPAPSNCAESR